MKFHKAKNLKITREYIVNRTKKMLSLGYDQPKWLSFCSVMMDHGLSISLYEAKRTLSKYVTVRSKSGAQFKVRFSNHKPIKHREVNGDCDFFVGVTNLSVTRTEDAVKATLMFFNISTLEGE